MKTKDLLTADEARKLFRYEESTGKLYWRKRKLAVSHYDKQFNTRYAGKQAGYTNKRTGYTIVVVSPKTYRGDKLVWLMKTGKWPEGNLVHKNKVRHDDRFENLKVGSNNRAGVQGITWHKQAKKWIATAKIEGETVYLGLFESLDDAIRAQRKARKGAEKAKRKAEQDALEAEWRAKREKPPKVLKLRNSHMKNCKSNPVIVNHNLCMACQEEEFHKMMESEDAREYARGLLMLTRRGLTDGWKMPKQKRKMAVYGA